jgi:hypothetical protein
MYHNCVRTFDISSSLPLASRFTGIQHIMSIFPRINTIILPTLRIDLQPTNLGKRRKVKITVILHVDYEHWTEAGLHGTDTKALEVPKDWEVEWRWDITVSLRDERKWSRLEYRVEEEEGDERYYYDEESDIDEPHYDQIKVPDLLKREVDSLCISGPIFEPETCTILRKRSELGYGPIAKLHIEVSARQRLRLNAYPLQGVRDFRLGQDQSRETSCFIDAGEVFARRDWNRLVGLKNLDISVGDLVESAIVDTPRLNDGPLNLQRFVLRITSKFWAEWMYDEVPTASSLVAAMLAIGGPLCHYTVHLEHIPENPPSEKMRKRRIADFVAISRMYNQMVQLEIEARILAQLGLVGWKRLGKLGDATRLG